MKVTAVVRYDLYPYFLVLEGDLQENGDVKTSCGTYAGHKILNIRPAHEYEMIKNSKNHIKNEFDKQTRELMLKLIDDHAGFLPVSYIKEKMGE